MDREGYQKKRSADEVSAMKKEEKSFFGFFVKNFRFTYLLIITISLLGAYALWALPREANPEVKIPFAAVSAVFPGATPADMEDLVIKKLENKIKNLDGLRRFNSRAGQGFASIFVEFYAEEDIKDSLRKLREAVDDAAPDLPAEAETPVVLEINANDIPIVTYSLAGNLAEKDLKIYADRVQEEFEQIANVSKVVMSGEQQREFLVALSQNQLAAFNLTPGQVAEAISRANFSLPAGQIDIDGFNYNIRVEGKIAETETLNDLVIATYGNAPVFLRDIALVKDTFKEKTSIAKLGFAGEISQPTISLQIYKKTGGNILKIITAADQAIGSLAEKKILPADLEVVKTNDNAAFIREDLRQLGTNGLQTVILITLLLALAVSWRGALITALAVPFAFFMAFIFLLLEGMTLNSLVLFSLVLSLGLMVDNVIVINEGINEFVNDRQKRPYEAALLAIAYYKWPIISGTMTTVAAFLPMLLVSGILGEYLKTLPMTISATLISSLFIALGIVPPLVARLLKVKFADGGQVTSRGEKRHLLIAGWKRKTQNFYEKNLRSILPSQTRRRLIIGTVWFVFVLALAVPFSGLMKIELFSEVDVDYFAVNIKLPAGSTLAANEEKTAAAEKIIAGLSDVDNYVTVIGSSINLGNFGGGGSGSHLANITVNLKPKKDRAAKSYEIADDLRARLTEIPNAEINVESISAGPPSGSPIEVRLTGDDLGRLAAAAEEIKGYFALQPAVINIKDNTENGAGDFTFHVDRQKANYYGLDNATVAAGLRTALSGAKASTVNLNGEDIDITVKNEQNEIVNITDLQEILLPNGRGELIPLRQIASLRLEPSLLSINHLDGKRAIVITADTTPDADKQKIFRDFAAWQAQAKQLSDINITSGGEMEDINKSFRETFLSMIVAIILIAFILVLQFNSFRQPFIILFTLPLALIGVIFGLNLLRLPFSFPAFIGLVSLAGIAVNDAIILIDRINKNLADGLELIEGIIEAGRARIQPIFLTTATTIAGILPLAFTNEFWVGLSVTIIFGLFSATLLTLIIVPIMYVSLCAREKCSPSAGQNGPPADTITAA